MSPTPPASPWEGKCKFERPGTYKFESSTLFKEGGLNYTEYEIVVEAASTGTTPTTMGTTTTTTPTSPSSGPTTGGGPGSASPSEPGLKLLKLPSSQHGSAVHGSIEVSQADAGGRLEIGLFADGASQAGPSHSAPVRVGRAVRSSVRAGSVSFSVPLTVKGKASLRRRHHLALTVKISLTPVHGAVVRASRVVLMHS